MSVLEKETIAATYQGQLSVLDKSITDSLRALLVLSKDYILPDLVIALSDTKIITKEKYQRQYIVSKIETVGQHFLITLQDSDRYGDRYFLPQLSTESKLAILEVLEKLINE